MMFIVFTYYVQDLAKHLPTDDLLLFGEAKEITSLDEYVAKQYKEDKNQVLIH